MHIGLDALCLECTIFDILIFCKHSQDQSIPHHGGGDEWKLLRSLKISFSVQKNKCDLFRTSFKSLDQNYDLVASSIFEGIYKNKSYPYWHNQHNWEGYFGVARCQCRPWFRMSENPQAYGEPAVCYGISRMLCLMCAVLVSTVACSMCARRTQAHHVPAVLRYTSVWDQHHIPPHHCCHHQYHLHCPCRRRVKLLI